MNRIAVLIAGLLLAQVSYAGPNWQVTSFAAETQNVSKVIAATDKLMNSAVGKSMPGTVTLMVNQIDGASPATHSYITAFDSFAAREAYFQKLQADPAWAQFQKAFTPLSEPAGISRMSFLKSWGTESNKDVVWHIHAFTVSDPQAYSAALDALMASKSSKGFPGRVHLSAVDAAGMSDSTHLVSVGYESEAEGEAWNDKLVKTGDWATFMKTARTVSQPNGTFVIRTVKSWGDTAQ